MWTGKLFKKSIENGGMDIEKRETSMTLTSFYAADLSRRQTNGRQARHEHGDETHFIQSLATSKEY